MKVKKKKDKLAKKWNEGMYVRVYELAKAGLSKIKVAEGLGVQYLTLKSWFKQNEYLVEAYERGKGSATGTAQPSFSEFVYNRLSPELQSLWDQINECQDDRNAVLRIEALLADKGERTRQHLFLYALTNCSFDASEALKKVNVSKSELDRWILDPPFQRLMDEIQWHKGNFIESAVFDLIRERDPGIVAFASKTFNRDRGFNDKREITVNHQHSGAITLESLDLPLDVRRVILEALRNKQKALEMKEHVEEAEVLAITEKNDAGK